MHAFDIKCFQLFKLIFISKNTTGKYYAAILKDIYIAFVMQIKKTLMSYKYPNCN